MYRRFGAATDVREGAVVDSVAVGPVSVSTSSEYRNSVSGDILEIALIEARLEVHYVFEVCTGFGVVLE